MSIKEKAWNLTFAYSLTRGSCKTLQQEQANNAHAEYEMPPNRAIHVGRSAAGYTYPKGRLLPSCFGLRNFAGFRVTKTSANKRFYNMSAKPIAQLCAAKLQHFFGLCNFLV